MKKATKVVLGYILHLRDANEEIHLKNPRNIDEALEFCKEGYLECLWIKNDKVLLNGAQFKVTQKGLDSLTDFRTMLNL